MATYNYSKPNFKFAKNALDNERAFSSGKEEFAEGFKRSLDKTRLGYYKGNILTLYLIGDKVYAIIERNHEPIIEGSEMLFHGNEIFNLTSGIDPNTRTIPELVIPTDINPSNININRYIGKECTVKTIEDRAIVAYVDESPSLVSIFSPLLLQAIRNNVPNGDLKSTEARTYLKSYGYSDIEIDNLLKLTYDSEEFKNKLVTFSEEAVWTKDTSAAKDNEIILETNETLNGLNKLGMKSNNCHLPVKLFSGK